MKKFRGTSYRVPILILILIFICFCSVFALGQAQDKLLTNSNSNNSTASSATVDCAQTDAGGNCVAGQYFHSDAAEWWNTWNPTFQTASPRKFGGYKAYASGDGYYSASNLPSNPCWGCHHGSPTGYVDANGNVTGNGIGANYMTMGHKNMLRKVKPGQAPYDTQGLPLYSETGNMDAGGNLYDWTGMTLSPDGGTTPGPASITLKGSSTALPLYYLFGWTDAPDTLYQGGGNGSAGFNYQCARCHTTGYRFDNAGPEPTDYNLNGISDANLSRYPASGGKNQGETSSWYLSGIQCERCHQADMQYDPAVYNPTVNSPSAGTSSGGRISHLVNALAGSTMPDNFWINPAAASGSYTRPLPKVPVNEKAIALCIQCHRQEVSKPGTGGVLGEIHPTQLPGQTLGIAGVADGAFKSGGSCSVSHTPAYNYTDCLANGGTYGPYVPSMSHGANGAEAYLNSPHARFVGTFDQTAQNSPDLSVTLNGTFNSHFTDRGQAPYAKTGTAPQGLTATSGYTPGDSTKNGGCTNCHDVHNTLLEVNATNVSSPIVRGCVDCHTNNRYGVSLPTHSHGDGTPFPETGEAAADPNTPCITCHMGAAKGSPTYHYFRINPDVNYNTFPSAAQYYSAGGGNQQPNTFDETYYGATGPAQYKAVALDVDIACGQCHTGGDGKSSPYGIVPTSAPAFTRAQLSVFATGMHTTVPKVAMAPTFTVAGSTYKAGTTLSVGMTEPTINAKVCYTTDGSTPRWEDQTPSEEVATMLCTSSPTVPAAGSPGTAVVYDGTPVSVTTPTTFKAIGGGTNTAGNVFTPSAVVSISYKFVAALPTFTPASGQYNVQQSVALAGGTVSYCAVPLGQACTPTTAYTAPLTVSVPTTIRAVSAPAGYTSSAVTSSTYNIVPAPPTFSLAGGSYTGTQSVTITGPTGTTIYYTTNGSIPTTSSASIASGGTVQVPNSMYLRAIAAYTVGAQTAKSSVATVVYSVQLSRPGMSQRYPSTATQSAPAATSQTRSAAASKAKTATVSETKTAAATQTTSAPVTQTSSAAVQQASPAVVVVAIPVTDTQVNTDADAKADPDADDSQSGTAKKSKVRNHQAGELQ
jgi:hypothetical protein